MSIHERKISTQGRNQKERYAVFDKVAALNASMTPERKNALSLAGTLYKHYNEGPSFGDGGVVDSNVKDVGRLLILEANGEDPANLNKIIPGYRKQASHLLNAKK